MEDSRDIKNKDKETNSKTDTNKCRSRKPTLPSKKEKSKRIREIKSDE